MVKILKVLENRKTRVNQAVEEKLGRRDHPEWSGASMKSQVIP